MLELGAGYWCWNLVLKLVVGAWCWNLVLELGVVAWCWTLLFELGLGDTKLLIQLEVMQWNNLCKHLDQVIVLIEV